MEYIGEIRSHSDDNPLQLDAWMEYIGTADDFSPMLGRPGINPADGTPIVLQPPANAIRMMLNDREVGGFSWGPEEHNCILVSHAPECRSIVIERANKTADDLGVRFIPWETETGPT